MIRDDKLIPVQNLTASTVSYIIPETNNVRRFSGQQLRKDITAGELRSLYGTKGGRVLIEDYLGIKDRELAQEFTGRDVGNMIKLDTELENPKEETPSRGTRRVVSNIGASQNQRRASE